MFNLESRQCIANIYSEAKGGFSYFEIFDRASKQEMGDDQCSAMTCLTREWEGK